MRILVIWRLLTVGGVNAGWRNRAIHFKKYGITTDFLYTKDLGGMHIMEDIADVYLTKDKNEIVNLIQEKNYDAIIVIDTDKAYKWIAKARYNGPVIVEARTPEIIKIKPHVVDFDKVTPVGMIVPSEHQKRVVSILVDEQFDTHVIHNGIDTSFFSPLLKEEINFNNEPFLPEDKKIVAYIGRVDKRKNWRMLLKVAKLVKKERDDIQFWVVGGNKSVERDLFEQTWKSENLTDIVKWFPVIPYQQMPHMYAKVKQSGGCTLAPTRGESFGNTFIESMACGVPVAAPKISSIPEIVLHGETGRLFREEHVRGAVRQIYKIIDQTENYERMSIAARKRVEDHFSIEKTADQYVKLLRQLIGGEVK